MKKVLCVIDMQNDFITGCLGNDECRAVVDNVVNVINDNDYDKVFVTKDTHTENYMETQEGRKLPVVHCVRDTHGWNIDPRVVKAIDEKYETEDVTCVCKPVFGSVELSNKIKEYKDDVNEELEIYFCGVCTGICVISNVLIAKAVFPEDKVIVIENACACVTPDTHTTAINAMKTCQVDII